MFNTTHMSQFFRSHAAALLLFSMILALVIMPDIAHAAVTPGDGTADGSLPFEEPLHKLVASITGPVAFGISLIGIIAAGAVLIFGGEMSGFLRTLVFLVLVIALIVNASGLIKIMSGDGAVIASYIGEKARLTLGMSRVLG